MFAFHMRAKNILFVGLILASAIALLFSETGCASIVPPSGGPRDSLPPVIVSVIPENQTLNFNAKEIKIEFDEYVELNDPYKNLLISPFPKINPEVTRKLRTVTVKIKDTLQPNTTYVYNFANTIKDLNEGNQGKDLLYVVSTGTYVDSMELSGNVRMAKTGKADSTLSVMLYNNLDDSAIVKERPRYIARVDTTGTFFFRFLAPGKYRLYAMKDESGMYMYNGEQIFAFADSVVTIAPEPPAPVRMWAYEPEKRKEEDMDEETEIDEKEKRLKFNTNLEASQQDLLSAFIMTFDNPLKTFDTTKMSLSMDSTFRPITGHRFTLDSTAKIVTMNLPWLEDTTYNLVLEKEFASDSLNRQIFRKDTITFKTKARTDYGQVRINFVDIEMDRNPVLLITQGETIKNAFPIPANRVIELQLYNPGEYDMKILYDKNKNGKWDPGEFFVEHRQPELINDIDRKLIVRPDRMEDFELKKGRGLPVNPLK
ncbi:Ig-like domain-containing domain [Niabella ginsengisoli]|uniref:Ig-like domain-containing protein n=1 Tax=Niabella ginsengisoli TaxID=522298 RepID=A0ABS9SPB7_9BACT|nr:Ig-like domain-containing domain [Niabella ginsengisoli]MCH5600197.1 Ig-like domain-containing protein [Niabella ginsengisoli]